jgi:hypothetical protein
MTTSADRARLFRSLHGGTSAGVAQAAYAVAWRAARELLADGTYAALADGLDYGELNALLS